MMKNTARRPFIFTEGWPRVRMHYITKCETLRGRREQLSAKLSWASRVAGGETQGREVIAIAVNLRVVS